jgi:hypothetical protein
MVALDIHLSGATLFAVVTDKRAVNLIPGEGT